MIVDSHVHIASHDRERYPIRPPKGEAAAGLTFLWFDEAPVNAEMMLALMAEAGVDATVLVQPISAYQFDNSYIAVSAAAFPEAFASVCIIRMGTEDAADRLDYWVRERGVHGVRIFASVQPDPWWLDDPKSDRVWEQAQELGIPVCMQMRIGQIPRLRTILQRFPDLTIAIDHLASLHREEKPGLEAAGPLMGLDKFPNVHLKYSTMNLDAWAREGKDVTRDCLARLVDRFGSDRLIWGSNFPATYDQPYAEMVDLARETVAFLSEDERGRMLGGTALKLWPSLAQ